jgi:hypothetical protein
MSIDKTYLEIRQLPNLGLGTESLGYLGMQTFRLSKRASNEC